MNKVDWGDIFTFDPTFIDGFGFKMPTKPVWAVVLTPFQIFNRNTIHIILPPPGVV